MTKQSPSEHAIDAIIRLFGESQAMFDPLRFRVWTEMGLTTAQLRVLAAVREHQGISSGDLARMMGVTPPTITGLIDRLERLGMVCRAADPDDRRLVRHHLSELGEQTCSQLERGSEIFTRAILVEMNHEDLSALLQGMDAFVRASRAVFESGPDLATLAMAGTT